MYDTRCLAQDARQLPGVIRMIVEGDSTHRVLETVRNSEQNPNDKPGAEEQQPEADVQQLPATVVIKMRVEDDQKWR